MSHGLSQGSLQAASSRTRPSLYDSLTEHLIDTGGMQELTSRSSQQSAEMSRGSGARGQSGMFLSGQLSGRQPGGLATEIQSLISFVPNLVAKTVLEQCQEDDGARRRRRTRAKATTVRSRGEIAVATDAAKEPALDDVSDAVLEVFCT